ncbi:MAG: tetratricopeptide repeat protein [Terriglobales bacterium]
MKTSLVALLLALANVASGQNAAAPQPQASQPQSSQPQAGSTAPPTQKKEIKDPAEYNAYVGAVQQSDPAAKISGLEAFLTQYPNSVMKEDALELLMGTYQQSNNQAKVIETANRLLAANPNNARALVLLAYNERATQKWADAKQHAEHGLQALDHMAKADNVSEADFAKQKKQLAGLLNSVAGFSALQLKDYAEAQKYLRPAVEADPNNVENVYPLALSYLTATPPDDVNGLFFIARAANLVSDPKGKDSIIKFGRSRYMKYHGTDQGWDDLLAQTKTTPLPPAGFTITQYVPPTPQEQAADLVKKKKPEEMSFAEWELVLSVGAQADQDTVWNALKGKNLQMAEVEVITASPTKLGLAASVDDIDQKRADIELSFPAAIPARMVPKEGDKINFEGTPVSYTPSPFVMVMEKGALLTKAAPSTPARKPPVRRNR